MTDTLDAKLRAITTSGNFSHLSILSSGNGFHATFCPAAAWGSGHGFALDPIDAAMMAIDNAPKNNPKDRTRDKVYSPAQGEPRKGITQGSKVEPPTPVERDPVQANKPQGRVATVNLGDLWK